MQGDFSRLTFDPRKHYSRVLMQQGRVQLDADWNEQVAILLHRLETLAADLIGPFGGPKEGHGFSIGTGATAGDFTISAGRYYIGGLLCQNDKETTYHRQPIPPAHSEKVGEPGHVIIYLDAWEQYVNAIGDPHIRETALGGPDTAGRSKVVWQVRCLAIAELAKFSTSPGDFLPQSIIQKWQTIINTPLKSSHAIEPRNRGLLSVNIEQPASGSNDPCIIPPSARYRGLENQLYRIEIHTGGEAGSATFIWSRENGSVIHPVDHVEGSVVTLQRLGADPTLGLKIDDWVEMVDEHHDSKLFQIKIVDSFKLRITVAGEPKEGTHSYLRRWDQKHGTDSKGGVKVVENTSLTLEDGIQIRFEPGETSSPNIYRKGDFWCIPARTVDDGRALSTLSHSLQPDGIDHHYAPLAIVDGNFDNVQACLKIFDSTTWCNLKK